MLLLTLDEIIYVINIMDKIEYKNRLRVIMADKQLTNIWLAEQLGVTDITVSRWRTNKVQPSMSQFVSIAKLLKVDIKELIEAEFNYVKD